jgi:hypothetical protein
MEHLALEIAAIHHVIVHKPQVAYSGGGKVERGR